MTFRQYIEQGTQFSPTGLGQMAGRAGESPVKVGKPQTSPLTFRPEMPQTKPLFRKNKPRAKDVLKGLLKPTKIPGVI